LEIGTSGRCIARAREARQKDGVSRRQAAPNSAPSRSTPKQKALGSGYNHVRDYLLKCFYKLLVKKDVKVDILQSVVMLVIMPHHLTLNSYIRKYDQWRTHVETNSANDRRTVWSLSTLYSGLKCANRC
jgi:hypothetical protein